MENSLGRKLAISLGLAVLFAGALAVALYFASRTSDFDSDPENGDTPVAVLDPSPGGGAADEPALGDSGDSASEAAGETDQEEVAEIPKPTGPVSFYGKILAPDASPVPKARVTAVDTRKWTQFMTRVIEGQQGSVEPEPARLFWRIVPAV